MYLLSSNFLTIASSVHWLDYSTAELCICFSTVHIVGSFYLNFLRWNMNVILMGFSLRRNLWHVHCDFAFRCWSVKLSSLFTVKTPGVAPEGQGTLRASTLQGCGPDTETRMNDMWHVVCYGRMFTSPEVRTFQEALLLSPGNSQINGDLMVRQSQVTSSHCFHGEPFCWVFVSLPPCLRCRWRVGSCEMMKRNGLRDSTRIVAMFPCVQALIGVVLRPPEPNGTGEMFQNSLQFVCDLCSKLHGNWYWYGAC